ncbi:phosphonatase-like hydrolase [Persicitalea jodogahamensis]|uniref:Phosphatase n=1 Tax=Persicitalea jodogahamensis TaxID=402147 RepID=A0A8J3D3G7_9BACT|nr:phosphonatase-like hydrolase [Persicitalea jodogahamensis]GHB67897.1 phosphatase [Persicitalea jodogahamensis]
MKKIELAVFDMAGTTVNEDNVVYKTLQRAIDEAGYETTLDFVLAHGAGKEKHQAIKDIIAETQPAEEIKTTSDEIFERFKSYLSEAYDNLHVVPCEGVVELLTFLKEKGIKVALNTGYNAAVATSLLEKMGWKKGIQYDTLVTASDVTNGRPAPDMILKAMSDAGVTDAGKVLKAGDSTIDIEEGKNASCGLTVGVTTGAHTRDQLQSAQPDYVVDSLLELKEILV